MGHQGIRNLAVVVFFIFLSSGFGYKKSQTSAVSAATQNDISGKRNVQTVDLGKKVFQQHCSVCHQPSGSGISGTFPPLAKSDYLMANKDRSIRIVSKGLNGTIKVNGKTYSGAMPPIQITNEDIANVLSYVRNAWGNQGDFVTVEDVKRVKATL